MKPYVFETPGAITVTLDERAMMKIHDYYEEQSIADEIKKAYPRYKEAYCEVLAKKVRSLMWNEDLSESEAIDQVIDEYPAEDVKAFAKSIHESISEALLHNLPEYLSDMEDITEILMTISENAALYTELPFEKDVKKALTSILELSDSLQPVTISGPKDVKRLQGKLQLIKQVALSLL